MSDKTAKWTPERRVVAITTLLDQAVSHLDWLLREAPHARQAIQKTLQHAEIAQQMAGRDLAREMSLPSVMASDRETLIRLASELPKGSPERRSILKHLAAVPLGFAGPEHVAEVRKMAQDVARKHGLKVNVRAGTGSVKGMVLVMVHPDPPTTAPRLELIEKLQRAGYEDAVGGNTLEGLAKLSREWDHTHIRFHVAPKK
jgi:hypothetical protein